LRGFMAGPETHSEESPREVSLRSGGKQALRPLRSAAAIIAIIFSLFHLYTSAFGVLEAYLQRSIDLTFILMLVFLSYPFSRKRGDRPWSIAMDLGFAALMLVVGIYIYYNSEEMLIRAAEPTWLDLFLGAATLLLVLEAARRAVGMPMVILTLAFFVYALYGRIFPTAIAHAGFSVEEIISLNFMATDGLYGLILGVLSTFIIIFVIFSAFMEETGAVSFFIELANALAGHRSGGPAKVAVVSSTFIGSLSGASAANVVTTGSFTIPLMKKMGYRPAVAGAVEAAASTGGQIMPPVMGASAFVISAILGISYVAVMRAAVVPALLYFFSVGMVVHFICLRVGLVGLPREQLPSLTRVLRQGWLMLGPVFIIVYFLLKGYTPMIAGLYAVIATIIITAFKRKVLILIPLAIGVLLLLLGQPLKFAGLYAAVAAIVMAGFMKEGNLKPLKVLSALERAGRGVVSVGVTSACAGVIVSLIVISGLGMRLTELIRLLSGGNLLIALFFTMIAALVLGMGMPTVGAYIIVATLGAPALQNLGVSAIASHMFVFFFAIICNVTPPVALAAYAAAPIAESDPWETGWLAFRYALAGFLVPYFFVFNNSLLLVAPSWMTIWYIFTAVVGVVCLAAGVAGYFLTRMVWAEQVISFVIALLLLHVSTLTDIVGFAALASLLLVQRLRMRRLEAPASSFEGMPEERENTSIEDS
ncbi:MAG: TRAP transporter permease, partial [Nitrospinota bacterium]